MKKILFIIDTLEIGGAEKALLSQAKEFYRIGFEIHCIILYPKIQLEIPTYINLHCLNWKNYKILKYQRNIKKLYFLIDNLNIEFDLILVHLNKPIRLMQNYKHNYIYNIIHTTLSKNEPNLLVNKKELKKIRNIYDNLNIITVSEGIRIDILDTLGIKPKYIETIYNSIEPLADSKI